MKKNVEMTYIHRAGYALEFSSKGVCVGVGSVRFVGAGESLKIDRLTRATRSSFAFVFSSLDR